jgi:hypothetical protein
MDYEFRAKFQYSGYNNYQKYYTDFLVDYNDIPVKRILVVDDEPDLTLTFKAGFEV